MSQWDCWASEERMAKVANNALDYICTCYSGDKLYFILHDDFGMTDDEIIKAGCTVPSGYIED